MGATEKIADGLEKIEMMIYVALASVLVFGVATAVSFFFLVDSFTHSLVAGGVVTLAVVIASYLIGTEGDE